MRAQRSMPRAVRFNLGEVKPWQILATAPAPGGGVFTLARRERELVIRVDGAELMSSHRHGSEEEMAAAAAPALGRPGARALVGGLGFGYTLRAALDRLGAAGKIVVAEISPAIIDWNRRLLGHLAGDPLDDPRAAVTCADVRDAIAAGAAAYDAILIDVDNGPWPLTAQANGQLWRAAGIAALARALRPGGTLVVWSTGPDTAFAARLRAAGFTVDVVGARAQGGRGARHTLFVAEWRAQS